MSGIARVGVDTAGGTQLQGANTTVFVNGVPAQVLNGPVAGHDDDEHDEEPTMVSASSSVFFQGMPVCRMGDNASCGHTSTGSSNVFAG